MDAGLQQRDAAGRFFTVDRDGLLVQGMDDIAPYQKAFVQKKSVAGAWKLDLSLSQTYWLAVDRESGDADL
jgi:malate dehydrogenase (oxaloacetate-decarboxylating)